MALVPVACGLSPGFPLRLLDIMSNIGIIAANA